MIYLQKTTKFLKLIYVNKKKSIKIETKKCKNDRKKFWSN